MKHFGLPTSKELTNNVQENSTVKISSATNIAVSKYGKNTSASKSLLKEDFTCLVQRHTTAIRTSSKMSHHLQCTNFRKNKDP